MSALTAILVSAFVQQSFWHMGLTFSIRLAKCRPPDYPQNGKYGPILSSYLPGDVIHYYCDPGTYIGGNFRRVCIDNGDWSGDTPVCDSAAVFAQVRQSSTAEPQNRNGARLASDAVRDTCSRTLGEASGAVWTGVLQDTAREVIRVMLLLPKGEVSYEVFMVKSNGTEVSCGRNTKNIVIYDWEFHNCPQPHNTDGIAIKVKSLTDQPLEICHLVTHTLTDPTCVDPHFQVDNGRLILSRKNAILSCDDGYTRWDESPTQLECIRTGVWTRKPLYCEEKPYEINGGRKKCN